MKLLTAACLCAVAFGAQTGRILKEKKVTQSEEKHEGTAGADSVEYTRTKSEKGNEWASQKVESFYVKGQPELVKTAIKGNVKDEAVQQKLLQEHEEAMKALSLTGPNGVQGHVVGWDKHPFPILNLAGMS